MKNSTTTNLILRGKWLTTLVVLLVSCAASFAQLTVTKTYTAPSSVTVDGCGTYCTNVPGVTFAPADFAAGVCQIADVNVSITWAKTDGTCTAPLTGSSFHNETNFRIDGPLSNTILVLPGTYSGNGSTSSVTTILDQAAATIIGGVDPVSGTFRPNNGNLDLYNGTSPFGTWTLRAGDTGIGDPLCIVGYSVTITMSLAVDVDGDGYTNCNGDCNDNNPLVNPGAPEIPCDGINNDCNALTVDDAIAPTATCQNITVNLDAAGTASITGAQINMGSSDNCSIASLTATPNSLTCANLGSNSVTLTVTDGIGNASTCLSTVTVIDTLGPVADLATLPDVTGACEVTTLTPPTATDNCTGPIVVTHNATLPINTSGTTVVIWTYTDGEGNTSTQPQNVVITDNTGPVADLPALSPATGVCDVASITAPTATDACSGSVTGTTSTTFPITTQGTTTITWTYTDASGNTSTQNQDVIIVDAINPVPDVAALSTVTDGCAVSLTPPTATDNCSGSITGTTTTTFPITTLGSTVVTWLFDDGNGNITSQTQTAIVTTITATTTSSADGVTLSSDLTGADSYQWINCATGSPIIGATSDSYTATANGSYAVIVTDGACVDTSSCVAVSSVSLDAMIIDHLRVHPNPTSTGHFNITFDGVIHSITVLDMLGREIPVEVDTKLGTVDGSSLMNGRYMVRVETNKGMKVTEIIISM